MKQICFQGAVIPGEILKGDTHSRRNERANYLLVKKCLMVLVFACVNLFAFSQVIKGTIKDKKTDEIVCFASVYFNGTFVGTSSDKEGNFVLDVSKNKTNPLTVSAVGYYSETVPNFLSQKSLVIYLTPKEYEVNEIVVSSKSLVRQRKANMKLFKKEFIGTTLNAARCFITNESDITFNYDSDDDTLKVYASKPILIDNKALGYKITFFLDRFEYYKKTGASIYTGTILFKEDSIMEVKQKQIYDLVRRNAYLGSRMHFFRALWANELSEAGFVVQDSNKKPFDMKSFIFRENSNLTTSPEGYRKYISCNKPINVYYNSLSVITFLKPKIYFDNTGYFDQMGISWSGEMSEKRLGDQLPFEYSDK